MLTKTLAALAAAASVAQAWMPEDHDLAAFNQTARTNSKRSLPSAKIRGVNLGGQFVTEPWMMSSTWHNMGCNPNNLSPADCSNKQSEFDCMLNTNGNANSAFHTKMANWITPSDIQAIHDAGLNTIRIPLGYWTYRDLVYSSEHFPDGQMQYLDAIVQKASDLGMFVVIDLHAAPYAQKVNDAFTGQCASSAGFFQQGQYDRATKWLSWMTNYIHTHSAYDNTVGIIEVVNEPQTNRDSGGIPSSESSTLAQNYYPQALKAVRDAESSLGTASNKKLHVQFMDKLWGAGDPTQTIGSGDMSNTAFDDHNYVYLGDGKMQGDYMYYTCKSDNRQADGESPKIVQEWALTNSGNSQKPNEFDPNSAAQFYKDWFTAQQRLYEKTNGWIFWTWKTELSDIRWDYSYALKQGIIPNGASALDSNVQQNVCCSSRWNFC